MISKSEILEFLQTQRGKSLKSELNFYPVYDWIDGNAIKQAIKESVTGEDAYIKLGAILTEADNSFENISFREDCYDYLIQKGFGEEEAYTLMEIIRKGQYRFEKYQIKSDKLSDDFCKWAKGVKYMPSRKLLKDMFETKTIYKAVIIEEFDDYYYKKLKKSMPGKIKNGEIEWIYSYGDKLIARGSKSVFDAVKKIVETKNCENPYIEPGQLYEKCQKLYENYKNKKFWFGWFK